MPAIAVLVGKWRIVERGTWPRDHLDLCGPAFLRIDADGSGEMALGALCASVDAGFTPSGVDFAWNGADEGDQVTGTGGRPARRWLARRRNRTPQWRRHLLRRQTPAFFSSLLDGHGRTCSVNRRLQVSTNHAGDALMNGRSPAESGRSVQQRAVKTRRALLEAALSEFARHGFEGASLRGIGKRAGLEHTLIKHHFSNKETLWRSTATFAFDKIYELWEEAIPNGSEMSAAERVNIEFRTLLHFTVENSDFYQFMQRENRINSPRLEWLVTEVLKPTRDRILPQIAEAQQAGEMIQGELTQVYHLLISMATALASQQGEMAHFSFKITDTSTIDAYWNIVQRAVFLKPDQGQKS